MADSLISVILVMMMVSVCYTFFFYKEIRWRVILTTQQQIDEEMREALMQRKECQQEWEEEKVDP